MIAMVAENNNTTTIHLAKDMAAPPHSSDLIANNNASSKKVYLPQFSVGSVEGVPFTACTSGPDIIILASNFSRVQQITASSPISSLDCSTDVGKIAAAYDNRMVIFEPIPLVQQQQQPQQTAPNNKDQQHQSNTTDLFQATNETDATTITSTTTTKIASSTPKLDYKWVQTATIESETQISVMSFNLEGNKLIAGGQTIQLWSIQGNSKTDWQCLWHCKTASNISYLKFSPDGTLFCSASDTDKLVKIWYESVTNTPSLSAVSSCNVYNDQTVSTLSTPSCLSPPPAFNGAAPTFTLQPSSISNQLPSQQTSDTSNNPNFFKYKYEFSFIYIAHPLPVTSLEWRRTSKYTPRGAVANVLITSCKDRIARIWVQTLLPDDGLVNFNQLKSNNSEDVADGAPRVQTQRHRQKLLRRLKRMKAFSNFKKRQALALDHSIDELEKVTTNGANNQVVNNESSSNVTIIHPNGLQSNNQQTPITTLPTALSAHDFHSYALCSTVIKPGLHFHLAGIIEPHSDQDTQSMVSVRTNELQRGDTFSGAADQKIEEENIPPQFVVHWINNKEIHITRSIELLLHDMLLRILKGNHQGGSSTNSPQSATESCSGSENDTDELDNPNDDTITAESSKKLRHKLCRKMNKQKALAASGRRDPDAESEANKNILFSDKTANSNGRSSPTSLVDEFDKTLESLLKKWQMSTDLLFSINKTDGTLNLWQVKYLDGEDTGVFRQVQIDRLSRLKHALPHYDAITMSLNVAAYSPSAYLDVKRAYLAVTNSSGLVNSSNSNTATFLIGDSSQFSPVDVPEILSINTDSNSINQVGAGKQLNVDQGSLVDLKDTASGCSISDAEPSIFIVTQHLSGILGLWKFNFDAVYPKVQSVDLVTRITGLPIDPKWLRDGILIVEYDEESSTLKTIWIADETERKSSGVSPKLSNPYSSRSIIDSSYDQGENQSSQIKSTNLQSEHASKPNETIVGRNSQKESQMDLKDSYRISEMASKINILPQYHLKQLVELLAFGKLQRVKAILNHLVNCLISLETSHEKDVDSTRIGPWSHRSRTLSIVGKSAPSFHDSFDIDNPSSNIQQQVIEEIELDYIEVTSIRPLPLYSILKSDTEKPHSSGDNKSATREEFSTSYESIMRARSQVDETLDEILGQSTIETLNKQKELKRLASDTQSKGALTSFNPKKAKLLTRVLTHTHLPGLSNVDQMHLLAVADAVALFDASPDDYHDIHDEDYDQSSGGTSMISTNIAIDSLDDTGLRFLTAIRQHVYLTRCLPMNQRNELKAAGIGNHNLLWAFHSESQVELISLIPCVQRNKPEWTELREFGIGWWLKKLEVLRKLIEKVAQSAYQAKQDPLDAALFYLAMKKKTLVCALMRRVNCDKRLLKLFEQDFNDPVNRKKALKNAYALLGLHRFEHAAAFFLLAGSIWDAVEVCINNLNDIQLAMVLIRLYDNDTNLPNNLKKLLSIEILGSKRPATESNQSPVSPTQPEGGGKFGASNFSTLDRRVSNAGGLGTQYNYDPARAHPDPFLRSMAFWKLGDYLSAVHTLLESDVGQQTNRSHRPSISQPPRRDSDNSQVANGSQLSPINESEGVLSNKAGNVSASVFNFYLFLKDQPLVAKHKQQLREEAEIKKRTSPVDEEPVHCHRARSLSSGELGFDQRGLSRAIKQSSTEFEVLNETTRLVDKYSDEAIAEKERVLFLSTANAYLEAGCPLLALEVLCSEDHLSMGKAQRMKFISCLHILMDELNTLATSTNHQHGISSSSTTTTSNMSTTSVDNECRDLKLEDQFYEWLEKSTEALKAICTYTGMKKIHDGYDPSKPSHDEVDDQEDGDPLISTNEPILRAMLTYCNMHSAKVNSLTSVRLELLSLLNKLNN